MIPPVEQDEEIQLSPWMFSNGAELHIKSDESWICLYIPNQDIAVAKKLSALRLPFFLPLGYDRTRKRFENIWRNYVFCRVNEESFKLVQSKIDGGRILRTALQKDLVRQLSETPPFVNIRKIHQPVLGEMVWISGGPLWGQRAFVTKSHVVKGDKIEVSIEMMGKWHHVHLPIRSVDHILETKELLPVRFKVDETAVDRVLDLEVCEINRELMSYLKSHPNLLYSLSPRKFELVVADILRAMGYDVTITPQTRDGGADILAVFKTPIGPVLTIVECKRFDKDSKVGIDIVERFLFSIREKFKASYGLIATTSFFTQGSLATQNDYHWQLILKDFNDIKGWLNNYGKWVEDSKSGIWLPGALGAPP